MCFLFPHGLEIGGADGYVRGKGGRKGSVWVCERGGGWSEGVGYVDVLEKGVRGWGHWLQCGHMPDF